MKYAICTAIIVAASLLAKPVLGEELVAEFSGERSMRTGEFEVKAPWILDWRVTGEYARDMAVDASLAEAKTSAHLGNVLKARAQGNGVRLFRESGRFYFRVDSTLAGWSLRVIQLTEEEAALYTPRGGTRLDY